MWGFLLEGGDHASESDMEKCLMYLISRQLSQIFLHQEVTKICFQNGSGKVNLLDLSMLLTIYI